MAKVDILQIQPTQLCKDLRGRFIEIYGREKTGKTSTAVMWPKPLLCAAEKGYNALAGIRPVDIDSWATFKDVCRQLKKAESKQVYETIILDTVDILYSMCEDYIKSQQSVAEISEIGYGKGWKMLRDEFEKTLRELTRQGYSLVFIAHSKTKLSEFVDENGEQIEQLCPNLSNACAEAVNGLVDIIAYLGIDYDKEGNAHRYLQTRATKTVFAGSRYRTLEPRIELGYKNLVDAVAKAMEDEAKFTGTDLITSNEVATPEVVERTFEEVMDEAKNLWVAYLDSANDEDEKERFFNTMQTIIGRIFGNQNFKLSQATPSQKDLVSLFIDELKDIM